MFHQLNVLAVKLNLLKIILPRKILAVCKCKKIVSCVCRFCQSGQSDVQFHRVASIHALEEWEVITNAREVRQNIHMRN